MKKTSILLILILSLGLYVLIIDFDSTYAAKTGGYNFCTQFPAFPECVGWRTEPIADNYWFCDYVYLKELCKNMPDPEKKIPMRTQDYCCKYIGPKLRITSDHISQESQLVGEFLKDKQESVLPLIIWTDKDHYNFREKTIVYGKFDFSNPTIIQNIKGTDFAQTGKISEKTFTVDIKLNGKTVLQNIPVNSNGWFSAFFYHNNRYTFSSQNNQVDVEYIITKGVIPPGGPKTHAIYQFTTGDITKKQDNFKIWLDDSALPNKIRYGVTVENPGKFTELARHDLVITRLTTPEGYVIPIESNFSIQDLSVEYSGFTEYGQGTYEIQVTYGNNTAKTTFEY